MNYFRKLFIVLWAFFGYLMVNAQPDNETIVPDIESLRYMYRKTIVEHARRDSAVEAPDWVKQLPDKFAKLLVERHLYKEGKVWGLAKRQLNSKLPYDEGGSKYFLDIVKEYNLWDKVPPLTEEKRKKAIEFWQSWQEPVEGKFIDPRDPERQVNEKFVQSIIVSLGGEPLYPLKATQQRLAFDEEGKVNTSIFLERTKNDPDWEKGGWSVGSHTGKMTKELWYEVNKGKTELIPDLRLGIEQILSHQDTVSGLWGPPEANLQSRVGGTLKIVARLYHGMGIEMPHSKELANSLIQYSNDESWFKMDSFSVPINVATNVSYCLETSDYRRDELFGVLESLLASIRKNWFTRDGQPLTRYRDTVSIGFEQNIVAALGAIGEYLNWKNNPLYPKFVESPYMQRGFGYRYIVKVNESGKAEVHDISQINILHRNN